MAPDRRDDGESALWFRGEVLEGDLHFAFDEFNRGQSERGEGTGSGAADEQCGKREGIGFGKEGGLESFLGEAVLNE